MSATGIQTGRPPPIHDAIAPEGSESGELSLDAVYHLLQNERRRCVISYLADRDSSVSRSEIAEQVAAWENGVEVDQIDSQKRKRVYIALHQVHLPKLDDAGIVEYDPNRGTVTACPLLVRINAIIENTRSASAVEGESNAAPDSAGISVQSLVLGLLLGGLLGIASGHVWSGIVTGTVASVVGISLLVVVAALVAATRRPNSD